jgi:thioredoxin-related protein
MNRRLTVALLLVFPSAICNLQSAMAEEVEWRDDYNKARQEAADKGRPLLLDFGTENCLWCKQLDLRTFKDPALAALLNERFVPLKLDGARNAPLVEALHIQNYPTLVFAAPDGRIIGYQEGFVEAPRLREQLQRVLASVSAPDWMARDYEEAVKAHGEARYARTVSLLKNVVEDGRDRPVQEKARQLLQTVEQQAAEKLARAKRLAEGGKTQEAAEAAEEVTRAFAGSQAARDAEQWLAAQRKPEPGDAARLRRARDLLAQAREDYRMQQFLCCLDRCEALQTGYADLPEASEAGQLAAEIKANPDWARQACEQMNDRLGLLYLAVADGLLKKGQPQQATYYLELVVKQYPGSRHAEAASARLAQIQGQPSRK